jgi:hypothetical protein
VMMLRHSNSFLAHPEPLALTLCLNGGLCQETILKGANRHFKFRVLGSEHSWRCKSMGLGLDGGRQVGKPAIPGRPLSFSRSDPPSRFQFAGADVRGRPPPAVAAVGGI